MIGWGGGLSHERKNVAEAETLGTVEGNMCGIATRDAVAPPGSKATSRPKRNASEPERSHVRPQAAEPTGPHREGEEPKPMMHGHEKSDSAIVAMKPPNNAGRPAAEAVERRAGAKENANRCCTCRTQGRESVSLAPERVRTATRPAVNDPRWEPYAGKLHVRICAGGAQ